jgi:hypothetical protein
MFWIMNPIMNENGAMFQHLPTNVTSGRLVDGREIPPDYGRRMNEPKK